MEMLRKVYKFVVLVTVIVLLVFLGRLYMLCDQQKKTLNSFADQQNSQSKFSKQQILDQQNKIVQLNKDLEDLKTKLDQQKNELDVEENKIQEANSENSNVRNSVKDVKTQLETINQDMKEWQKDYVFALAEIDKKTSVSDEHFKNVLDKLQALKIPEINNKLLALQASIDRIGTQTSNPISTEQAPPVLQKKPRLMDELNLN